ncbi:trehalose utilization protein [Saccharopolyspora lacisalsi]|uniref:Trehalose utilization protein n=1 Tax=Halosaccharopolyspora lacisalsi TaxID=1000566 RepID=A0A839DXF1_9PSEU|nr:hypothetical protein [Halosaccharopolyspora lacisalsi]MBA8825723.1 trehalose utilization protein [Halosaccharopolyspora lacisalsi]
MTTPEQHHENSAADLADRVAEVVLEHPCVVRLHGGEFGTISTHLPGRTVTGVRVGEADEPIEVAVVLRLRHPLPDVVTELRERVTTIAAVPVDVTVGDVVDEQRNEPGTETGSCS